MAAMRSKKSKIILVRASEAMLIGMNVANASRAVFESIDHEFMCDEACGHGLYLVLRF